MGTRSKSPKRRGSLLKRLMMLVVLLALLMIALVAGSWAWGRTLPSTATATTRMQIAAEPRAVWDVLEDYPRLSLSGTMSRGIERLEDENGNAVWMEDIGSTKIRVSTVETRRPQLLRRRHEDQQVSMTADVSYELSPREDGTRIVMTNETTLESGSWHVPFFRVILRLTNGPKRINRDLLERLAAELDASAQFIEPVGE